MYQDDELTKEARLLGRVTTLGYDRFIITVPKEDNSSIEHLRGKRVFVVVRDANEPITDNDYKQESSNHETPSREEIKNKRKKADSHIKSSAKMLKDSKG